MNLLDIFAFSVLVLLGVLLGVYFVKYHKPELLKREINLYSPPASWLRAGMAFCFFFLVSWGTGILEDTLQSPIATREQLADRSWWLWVIGLTCFILFAYWGIWARYTLRFDRKIDLIPQVIFGLVWGTALGLMLLSIWRIGEVIGTGWKAWQQWLLAYGLIGIWQWLLMDMFWDVYISPEHDTPKSIKLKTMITHIPNVTLCLIFIALYRNYVIFIALQTLALVGCSINMRMPAPWSKDKTPSARRVPSIFWGLPRCGGYIPVDRIED